ncbi:MAG TPA: OsmC family protein [Anaerolineales bacterium]|nr:OsmC family protein [Anaerolineales bacterium]
MKITAHIDNRAGEHHIALTTDDNVHSILIHPNPSGLGSSVNGGELLFLALATCYCNDIYREATKLNIEVARVEVEVNGDFGAPGEPAQNVTYRAQVHAKGSEAEIRALMEYTDTVAEIQNTLRVGIPVKLTDIEVINT